MNLREAIKTAEKKSNGKSKFAKDHAQLAKWLTELSHRRKADKADKADKKEDIIDEIINDRANRSDKTPYFDSEIFDHWKDQSEKRRKASRDPDWTPADIIV